MFETENRESELRPISHGAGGQIFLSNNFTEPYPKKNFMYAILFFVVLKPDLGPLVRIELALVSYFMNFSAWK